MVKIAPSTDPVKSMDELLEYAKSLEPFAHFLHVDVMNSNFVNKTTLTADDISLLNANTSLMLDVHLMESKPDVKKYIEAGANIVTVHYEAFTNKKDLVSTLKEIRNLGALVGLSIKPATNVEVVCDYLNLIDIILVMSVEPGKSGQKFLEETYSRVKKIKKYIKDTLIQIEVDGGVNPEVAGKLVKSGVSILVSGNYIYSSKNREEAILSLKQ